MGILRSLLCLGHRDTPSPVTVAHISHPYPLAPRHSHHHDHLAHPRRLSRSRGYVDSPTSVSIKGSTVPRVRVEAAAEAQQSVDGDGNAEGRGISTLSPAARPPTRSRTIATLHQGESSLASPPGLSTLPRLSGPKPMPPPDSTHAQPAIELDDFSLIPPPALHTSPPTSYNSLASTRSTGNKLKKVLRVEGGWDVIREGETAGWEDAGWKGRAEGASLDEVLRDGKWNKGRAARLT